MTTPNQQMTTEEALKASRLALDNLAHTDIRVYTNRIESVLLAQQALLESIAAAIAPKPSPPKLPAAPATFSLMASFEFVKAPAVRATREELASDPDNRLTAEVLKRLEEVETIEDLDSLLWREQEHDWLPMAIEERSLKLIENLLGAIGQEANQ